MRTVDMERNRYSRQRKRFFSSNMLIMIGMIIVAYQLFTYAKKVYQDYQIDLQVGQYEANIVELKGENDELREQIEYYQTDAYREKVAKGIAGLKNSGEDVVIIKGTNPASGTEGDVEPNTLQRYELTNAQKWWQYFFGERTAL